MYQWRRDFAYLSREQFQNEWKTNIVNLSLFQAVNLQRMPECQNSKKSSKFWLPYSLSWINSLRNTITPIIAIAWTLLALLSCFEVYPLITQISNQTQIFAKYEEPPLMVLKIFSNIFLTFFKLCSHEGSFDQRLKSSSTPLDSITDSKNVWSWQLFDLKTINDSTFSWTKVNFKFTIYEPWTSHFEKKRRKIKTLFRRGKEVFFR